jgi:hypothetical protein
MDERRTGDDGYRRPVIQARDENPQRPGRPIEPFGITKAEAKALADGRATGGRPDRPALGIRVRRWSNTGGETTKLPSETTPVAPAERLRRAALRLSDDDLSDLIDALKQEQRRGNAPRTSRVVRLVRVRCLPALRVESLQVRAHPRVHARCAHSGIGSGGGAHRQP